MKKMTRLNNQNELVGKIRIGIPDRFEDLLNQAIALAEIGYGDALRNSGEKFLIHGLNVALNCVEMKLDTDSVIAGLLHQTISSRFQDALGIESVSQKIKSDFGDHVWDLVEAMSELNEATKINKQTNYKVLTRYLLAGKQDIRPLLIKLADILDDLRTFPFIPQHKQKGFMLKMIQVYGPLAEYLNLPDIKNELEEAAFQFLYPDAFLLISKELKNKGINEELKQKYLNYLREAINLAGFDEPKIFGRIKSVFSIYNKISKHLKEGKSSLIDSLRDLLGFAIAVDNEADCYRVMEIVKDFAIEVLEIEDYIANPKPNGFRELQMTVLFSEISQLFVEVKILTHEMYWHNTYGPASHLAYKASKQRFAKPAAGFDWVENIHQAINEHINLRETERSLPITGEIFKDAVFVFTPKGELIEMRQGETAIDLAYRIHEDIGNSAVSAKIDGLNRALSYELKTGESVEILVQKGKSNPDPEWLKFAKSSLAQKMIKKKIKISKRIN